MYFTNLASNVPFIFLLSRFWTKTVLQKPVFSSDVRFYRLSAMRSNDEIIYISDSNPVGMLQPFEEIVLLFILLILNVCVSTLIIVSGPLYIIHVSRPFT